MNPAGPTFRGPHGLMQKGLRNRSILQKWLRKTAFSFLTLQFALGFQTRAALVSGAYQTPTNATVEEWGDRVPNGRRIVPIFATFTFDTSPLSFSATITNAVLEGGDPFPLTVRSSSGSQLPDGTYRFMGDYLGELYPARTQYLFDWRFSTSTNGNLVWNGLTAWVGGHAWYVEITNLTLTPVPWLKAKALSGSVQLSWVTNFPNHLLDCTTNLATPNWIAVTNLPVKGEHHFSVTREIQAPAEFYRLHRP